MSEESYKQVKICFVALGNTYPVLKGESCQKIVGTDIQQVFQARSLADRKYTVIMITFGVESKRENIDGIEVITIIKDRWSFRPFNIIYRVLSIWNSIIISKADVIIYTGLLPGVVIFFSRLLNKKSIYQISSDALVDRNIITKKNNDFQLSKFSIGSFGNWLDIMFATIICCQTNSQKIMLEKNYNRKGIVVKMAIPEPQKKMLGTEKTFTVLWVGAFAEVKQPQVFIELAKRIPEAQFLMIGGYTPEDEGLFIHCINQSKSLKNFSYLGVIPFNKIDQYFARSTILVNTSMFEGYPNAFIQAMQFELPIVSLHANPDGILNTFTIGFHSATFEQMIDDVKKLMMDPSILHEMGKNAFDYYQKEHNWDEYISKYENLITWTNK